MPFKSDKQRRYLWAKKPDVARKFAEDSQSSSEAHWWYRKKGKRKT